MRIQNSFYLFICSHKGEVLEMADSPKIVDVCVLVFQRQRRGNYEYLIENTLK